MNHNHPLPQKFSAIQRKVVVAACFGTFLEWYDFLTFASLASHFSVLFFPPGNPVAALLSSLATFGVGMLVRPLGAALFGSMADKYGRRPVFIATVSLMGASTFCVGLLPTYAEVGLLAPSMLLALRLLQGFAVGGEIGGVAVYLTEHAPENRRGAYTSVLQLMGPLGIMVSTLQVVALQAFISDADFHQWGWRVPFLFSAVLLAVSLAYRASLQESPVFRRLSEHHAVSRAPLIECLRDSRTLSRMALLFFCISSGGSLLFFCSQVYATVFLKSVVLLPAQTASAIVLGSTLFLFPLTILCGWLSDRVGRRPVLLAGLLLGAISIVPIYAGLLHFGNPQLENFNRESPVVVHGFQCAYSPFREPANDCERNEAFLIRHGVSYTLESAASTEGVSIAGGATLPGFHPSELIETLKAKGWTEEADKKQINRVMLFLLLLVPVVALALITGPQTAVLAELFHARVRYTAAALPHNLSAGWIGGLSPFVITLIGVRAGDAMSGLWYPVGWLAMASVIGLLFLPETKNVSLDD